MLLSQLGGFHVQSQVLGFLLKAAKSSISQEVTNLLMKSS